MISSSPVKTLTVAQAKTFFLSNFLGGVVIDRVGRFWFVTFNNSAGSFSLIGARGGIRCFKTCDAAVAAVLSCGDFAQIVLRPFPCF